jgi:hypothetical protein
MGGETSENRKKQSVWIVRYGLTRNQPIDGVAGPFDSKFCSWKDAIRRKGSFAF